MRPQIPAAFASSLILGLALTAAVACPAAAQQSIAPGYWESTNRVVSPLPSTKVDHRCIRPEDVAKFMEGPQNHIYHCSYPTRAVGEGVIRLKGSCKSRDGQPFPVSGEGTFTRDSFHMEAEAALQLGPLTVPMHAVTDAKRLSADCPAATDAAATAPSAPAGNEAPAGQ